MTESRSLISGGYASALVASVLMSWSVAIQNGHYHEPAIYIAATAIVLLVLSWAGGLFRAGRFGGGGVLSAEAVDKPLLAIFFGWVCLAYGGKILIYAHGPWELARGAVLVTGALLLTYVPSVFFGVREPPTVRHVRFGLFAVALACAGWDTVRASPAPLIDVWTLQQAGAQALLRGQNPFAETTVMPTGHVGVVPYVYPPTVIYVGALGFVLGGDVRYALIACVIVAGFAIRAVARRVSPDSPAIVQDAPALAIWLMPKLYFIIEQAWVDPIQLMFLSVGLSAFVRGHRILAAVVFGVAISSKQTMFWMVPLVGILLGFSLREWLAMGIAAAVPVAPFALWDFRAMKFSLFEALRELPARDDALNFTAWFKRQGYGVFPHERSFLIAAAFVLVSLLRRADVGAFVRASVTVYAVFFFFNKWAFANYYFLLAGLAALGAAAQLKEFRAPSGERPLTERVFDVLARVVRMALPARSGASVRSPARD